MSANDLKLFVENCSDMEKEMQEKTLQMMVNLVEKKLKDKNEMAANLLANLESAFGSTWNCAIGRDFGSSISYKKGTLLFAYVGSYAFLAFKSP